jgi:hypothetical protein
VSQPPNEARRGVFSGGEHDQYGAPVAVAIFTPPSAEDALTILRQHRDATSAASDEDNFTLADSAFMPMTQP